jgi:hypothetical protein
LNLQFAVEITLENRLEKRTRLAASKAAQRPNARRGRARQGGPPQPKTGKPARARNFAKRYSHFWLIERHSKTLFQQTHTLHYDPGKESSSQRAVPGAPAHDGVTPGGTGRLRRPPGGRYGAPGGPMTTTGPTRGGGQRLAASEAQPHTGHGGGLFSAPRGGAATAPTS